MANRNRKCYLCNNTCDKNKKISLHRFPQNTSYNTHVYQRWLEFCGLKEEDDVSHIYICTNHFCPENVKYDKTKRISLIYGAIPSVKTVQNATVVKSILKDIDPDDVCDSATLANTSSTILVNTNDGMEVDLAYQDNNTEDIGQDEIHDSATVVNTSSTIFVNTTNDEMETVDLTFQDNNTENIGQDDVCNSETLTSMSVAILPETIDDIMEQSMIENNTDSEEKQFDTPQKVRRFAEPRYVSEIQLTDVTTPRRTRRTLQLIKATDEKKSKEIKRLKDANRKLKKRIVSMQQMMLNLYQKGLISKKAEKTLMVN